MKSSSILLLSLAILIALIATVSHAINDEAFYQSWRNQQFEEVSVNSYLSSVKNSSPLDPTTTKLTAETTFSLQNAKIYSRLAAASYCAPPSLKEGKTKLDQWTCKACVDSGLVMTKTTPFHIALADLYGYMAYNPTANTIVVVFTGSQSIVNWLYNLDAAFIDFPGLPNAQVHKGFYNAWAYSRPTIIAMLDAFLYEHPTAAVVISGHSLGGAVANLATIDLGTAINGYKLYSVGGKKSLIKLGQKVIITPENVSDYIVLGDNNFDDEIFRSPQLQSSKSALLSSLNEVSKFTGKYKLGGSTYTFGAPRVGNNVLADWVNSKLGSTYLFRLTHKQDPVPHLPPLLLWKTAQHSTTEIFYKDNCSVVSDFTVCPIAETPSCSNQYLLPTTIDNHLNYMNYHLGTQLDPAC